VTSKRERDLERAKAARQAERQAAERARRRRLILGAGAAVVAVAVGIGVVLAVGGDEDTATPPTTSPATAPGTAPSTTSSAQPVRCAEPNDDLQTTPQQFPDGPAGITLPESTVGLTVTTNCGDLEIVLNQDVTPRNAAALVFLANTGAPICEPPGADCSGPTPDGEVKQVQGFWDNTLCHRLTTSGIFVLQCGDPTGTGTGDPGFSTPDENLDAIAADFEDAGNGQVIYPRGTVAMANSGPDTNGSQFFLVYQDSPLAPDYTVVGQVTKGLEILDVIAEAGVDGGRADGKPAQPLELEKVLSFERRVLDQ
jgi:peptidyl-prolyl cis-trans isomerase B (cyclophilin B)